MNIKAKFKVEQHRHRCPNWPSVAQRVWGLDPLAIAFITVYGVSREWGEWASRLGLKKTRTYLDMYDEFGSWWAQANFHVGLFGLRRGGGISTSLYFCGNFP